MVDDLTPPHWGDDFTEPKFGDVFTRRQAMSLAVTGYRVRAKDMAPGVYIDYQFAGWRINHPGGSSSGWSPRPHDDTVEWEVVYDVIELPCVTTKEQAAAVAKHDQKTLYATTKGGGKSNWGKGWTKATPDLPPGVYNATMTVDDKGRVVPDMVQPVKDKWGRASVGNVPKRDAWGRLISD